MKSIYRKAMEHLTLPPDALAKIQEDCRKDCLENHPEDCQNNSLKCGRKNGSKDYVPHSGNPALSKLAGTAAAAVLAAILLSTAAVSAYGHFFHPIPEDVAGAVRPIQLTSTSQGMPLWKKAPSLPI